MANKLESYIRSPELYFDKPADVLECSELTQSEMLVLLSSWKNDLLELQHANEENMPRQTPEKSSEVKLSQVLEAIQVLKDRPNL